MKSWVVLLSIKVAVISVSSTVILIFILSLLSGDISVGGTAVGAVVGGALVGVTGGAVGVGGTAVGDEMSASITEVGSGGVDVEACEQAVMRTAARMSTMIRL